jgi:16S rRNA (guanine527-N7)-methyltransferase
MIKEYIEITVQQEKLLEEFYQIHLNATFNLTAIKERKDFYIKHLLDSIYIFKIKNFKFSSLLDVGSGGGFPGLVIAIFYPKVKIVLCDSIKKKAEFLKNAVNTLGLNNVIVINDRVEHISKIKFDMITARGVAPVKKLLNLTKNVSHETTVSLFYKGEKLEEEIKEVKNIIKKTNKRVENVRIETPFKRTYCIIDNISDRMRR